MSRKKSWYRRTRRGRHSVRASGTYVSLYCRGTVSAPHEKWRIASFFPDLHEGELFWMEHPGWYAETDNDHLLPIAPPVTRWLDGNRYIPRDHATHHVDESDVDAPYKDTFRTVWELRCHHCGFKRTVRSRDAYPLLSALAGADTTLEVPIREFVSRVGG